MSRLITIPSKREKFDGPLAIAERDTSRMTRRAWLRLRHTGLGGTDSASLCFPDDDGGPLSVYVEKVDRPDPAEEDGDEYTDFGQGLEIVLRNTFLPTYLVRVLGLSPSDFRIYTSPWFYRSTIWKWRTSNLDGVIEFLVDVVLPDGNVIPKGIYVLELKTADTSQKPKWANGATPDRYFAQSQHYSGGMGMTGTLLFAKVNRTSELRFLPNHEAFQALIVERGNDMWQRIQDRNPPPAFGGDSDLSAARALYPEAGKELLHYPGLSDLAVDLVEARKRRDVAIKDVKYFEAKIKSATGKAGGLIGPGAKVKWRRWSGKTFDTEAFKLFSPSLYERFKTKDSPGNRVTVEVKGEVSDE